jgi:endogenous inhibitor of DNA gyrase (YacG/DUF329 family)
MAKKSAKARCPVCGAEVEDHDFRGSRAGRKVLKCPNCHNTLEWKRPWWQKFNPVHWILGYVPAWVTTIFGRPEPNSPYAHVYHIVAEISIALAVATAAGMILDKMAGQPTLVLSSRAYEPTVLDRLKEQRKQQKELRALRVDPNYVPPEFARSRSILGLESSTDQPSKWRFWS